MLIMSQSLFSWKGAGLALVEVITRYENVSILVFVEGCWTIPGITDDTYNRVSILVFVEGCWTSRYKPNICIARSQSLFSWKGAGHVIRKLNPNLFKVSILVFVEGCWTHIGR